jgi:hypothetical protein
VKDFSTIAAPLIEIVKKSVGFKWNDGYDKAFNLLKINFVLRLFSFGRLYESC